MSYTFDYVQRVNYVDTDKMGIMHNSNYFRFFEIGRNELMRNLGLSYKEIEDRGIMMPMVEQGCKYICPAYYDDEIIIRTTVKETPKAKIRFDYELIRLEAEGEERVLSTGYNMLGFIDENSGRPTRCPEWILEKLRGKLAN